MTADEAGLEIASSMESAGTGTVQINQQAIPAEKGNEHHIRYYHLNSQQSRSYFYLPEMIW